MQGIDARIEALWPAIAAHQDAYAAGHAGRRWQGLPTGPVPAEGTEELPTVGTMTPTGQPDPWPETIRTQPMPMALTVDCYDGPEGRGYQVTAQATIDGAVWARMLQVGAEGWRAFDWTDLTPPLVGVTTDTPRLTATFNSIGIEAPFTEMTDTVVDSRVYYRTAGEGVWREAIGLWPVRPVGQQAAAYGSILRCQPGTPYEVRVNLIESADGRSSWTGTVTTRAEDIPDHATLVAQATRFVSMTGSDSNDGLTMASAWRTLEKARVASPAGAVVLIGPGRYAGWSNQVWRATRLTLVAEHPAVDSAGQLIPANLRTIVEPRGFDGWPCVSAPTGATDPDLVGRAYERIAPWQQVTLVGPGNGGAPAGAEYTAWKWTNAPAMNAWVLGYAASRDDDPVRVPYWASMPTAEAWAELVSTNLDYDTTPHGACWSTGTTVYLMLPNDLNPNDYYITMGDARLWFRTAAANESRVCGLEFRCSLDAISVGYQFEPIHRVTVDRCHFRQSTHGINLWGPRWSPWIYGGDHVIQDNLFTDSNLWSEDPEQPAIPWRWIKQQIRQANGILYPAAKIGAFAENAAVWGIYGGAQRVVVRRNTIDGTFNGIGTGINSGYSRHASQDTDIHDNTFRHLADDAIEPEGDVINYRAWDNRIEDCLVALSIGPVRYGPVYFVNPTCWRIGDHGVGRLNDGGSIGGLMIKYSRSSDPQARVYIIGMTGWTDVPGTTGASNAAGGAGLAESLWIRNTIIRATRSALEFFDNDYHGFSEDHNQFSTSDPERGMKLLSPSVAYETWAEYRAAHSALGSHSNVGIVDLHDTTLLDAQFVDAANGDLRLRPDSVLRERGTSIAGVSPGPTPDLGAAPGTAPGA